jgi:glycine/D-amino acid oxidase-like deaminating enzyme
MTRRDFLQASATATAAGLVGCTPPAGHAPAGATAPTLPFYNRVPPIAPIRAEENRIFRITVCTRPFRAVGPRIEAERIGDKLIVHNYGHGGSGWSLSWGSGTLACELAFAGRDPSQTDVAVIGCGALGLTAAILAQRAGARSVIIYARDRPSETRSFRATGAWTPDSRVALTNSAPASFPATWEKMTRTSWHYYQSFLSLPGNPIEFNDRYYLSNPHPEVEEQKKRDTDPLGFAFYTPRVRDIMPETEDLPEGSHPFPYKWARRRSELMFNITAYSHQLTQDFLLNGGKIVTREFHSPNEFAQLPQPVILHSTGYGARALLADNSLTPVRGQIAWLIPQPEVTYGMYFDQLNILSRRDGIVVQASEHGEASGWNLDDETPDHGEAERAVAKLRHL